MPRKQAVYPEVNFVNGLVTETTALRFPENACTETWNCVFDYSGKVTRRPGLDVEDNYAEIAVPAYVSTDAYQSYLWETVNTEGTTSFVVVQRGAFLYFFEAGGSTDLSSAGVFQAVDLNAYVPAGSTADPAPYRCSITEGRGHLIVANPSIDPIYLKYEQESNTLVINTISIKYRDFTGLDDGLEINERVTSDVATLKTDNPEHYYNLLNQGWHHQNWLDEWDALKTTLPSNADTPSLFTLINNDNELVVSGKYIDFKISEQSNSPSAKGHFILDAGSPSRNLAMADEGFTGATVPESSYSQVTLTGLTAVTGGTVTRPLAMFDGNANQNTANSTIIAVSGYLGKTLAASSTIGAVSVTSGNQGSLSATIELYAKAGAAPASATDGTLLGTGAFNDGGGSGFTRTAFTIISSDPITEFDHVWLVVSDAAATIAEMVLLSGDISYYRPSLVSFFAGRVFYAGLPNDQSSNSIYFSQILERDDQYGKCHQKNDPTSPDFFDILSDDGGVITIPEIGKITQLFTYQNSMLVIATNGVWTISGSQRGPFQATDYSVRKISSIATTSGSSLVDRRGTPVWWAEDGIYTVQFNSNYDTFEVVSLTDQSIKTFIRDIPIFNRRYVAGAYDGDNDKLIWLFNDSTFAGPQDYYTYTKALCMDGQTKAFYPWSFATDSVAIKDIFFVRDVEGLVDPKLKLLLEYDDGLGITFGEFNNTSTWIDWDVLGDDEAYESYFVTGYKIRGETQKFSQINYIFVFMENEDTASLTMQAIHEFTNDSSSGKWSTPQQCYIDLPNKDVQYRRLKVRGKGRAIQIKMYSEAGKPFTCIGWSTNESVNQDV